MVRDFGGHHDMVGKGYYWFPVGGDWGCNKTLYDAQNSTHNKESSGPNANSARGMVKAVHFRNKRNAFQTQEKI